MSDKLKVGSKIFEVKPKGAVLGKAESRPGVWTITRSKTPTGFRVERSVATRVQNRFWLSTLKNHSWGTIEETVRGGSEGAGESRLVADFPGKVRKLLVAEGALVEAGVELILVEAMKMEFSIKAPTKGRVRKFLVKPDQQIQPGDKFVEFDPA